jgi:signal transduction histidine kinase
VVNTVSVGLIVSTGAILLIIVLRPVPTRVTAMLLVVQAGIVWSPYLIGPLHRSWISIAGLLAAAILVGLPPRLGWPLYALACLGDVLVLRLALPNIAVSGLLVDLFTDMNVGLSIFALRRLNDLVERARDAQRQLIPLELARDQLRTARALHAALGATITRIARGTSRVTQLLDVDPGRVRRELAELVEDARQALHSARHITGELRPLTLANELDAARAVLASAGIDAVISTTSSVDGPVPSKPVDTILAAALRRSVMTLVRHRTAGGCHISIPGAGRLIVTMDGAVAADLRHELAAELAEIAARAARVGGELHAPAAADQPLLVARMPLTGPSVDGEQAGRAAPPPADGSTRLAQAMLVFTVLDYVAVGAVNRLYSGGGHWPVAGPVFALTIPLAIFAGWPHLPMHPSRSRDAALIALGAASVIGFTACGPATVYITRILFSGLLANRLRPHRPWLPAVAIAAVIYFLAAAEFPAQGARLYLAISVASITITLYAYQNLPPAKAHLDATRGELARLAVSRERQRVGRDVHDMVGLHLSAFALQGELASRSLTTDPGATRTQLARMATLAEQARADIQTIASEPPDLSVRDELHNAASVLTAVGIAVEVEGETGAGAMVPGPADRLLGVVLREATANVLRHATAGVCRIDLSTANGQMLLRVTNDGAAHTRGTGGGTGLTNLAARATAAGGQLSAEPDGTGWFTLIASVPVATGTRISLVAPAAHGAS